MSIICNDIIQKRPKHIADHHRDHDGKEGPVQLVGQQIIQSAAGHQGECKINGRNAHGTAHIDGKQFLMIFKIVQKNHQGRFVLIVFCRHRSSSILPYIITKFP